MGIFWIKYCTKAAALPAESPPEILLEEAQRRRGLTVKNQGGGINLSTSQLESCPRRSLADKQVRGEVIAHRLVERMAETIRKGHLRGHVCCRAQPKT